MAIYHGGVIPVVNENKVSIGYLMSCEWHDTSSAPTRTIYTNNLHFSVPVNRGMVTSPSAEIPSRAKTFRTVLSKICTSRANPT